MLGTKSQIVMPCFIAVETFYLLVIRLFMSFKIMVCPELVTVSMENWQGLIKEMLDVLGQDL